MTLGPIEVVVIEFPGNRFNGQVLPELERLVRAGTISIVDGLLVTKDGAGATTFVEIDEAGAGEGVDRLADLCDRFDELISDQDVEELTAGLPADSSAAVLVFEHTWVRPLRDAIVDAHGVLTANIRVPREVVDEVMASLATTS